MRLALWLLALFALAVGLTLAARFDQGYVVIVYPPWRVEMSFMLGLTLALGLFFVGYAGMRLLRVALRLPEDVKRWRERKRSDCAERSLQAAMTALLEGRDTEAAELARRAAECGNPELARLIEREARRRSQTTPLPAPGSDQAA